jgi:hypothetical protein
MKHNLPFSAWGHAILQLHIINFLHYNWSLEENLICPILKFLVVLYTFLFCAQQCTKIEPQRRVKNYICFNSQSIIKYLESLTRAQFADRQFDETEKN